jgi:hypothetical protein
MGTRKKDGNYSPPQNKLVQDSEGNEENGYPNPVLTNKDKLYQRTQRIPQNSLKEKIL